MNRSEVTIPEDTVLGARHVAVGLTYQQIFGL